MSVLAQALGCEEAVVAQSIREATTSHSSGAANTSWRFLVGLDDDLRRGLIEELIVTWTHTSTSLEGNTIGPGDTLFVLREGLTVNGHSLREHQEIQGHAHAIELINGVLSRALPFTTTACHECHRMVQTGVQTDVLAPVGAWKIENNGTQAITSGGGSSWHDYAKPQHVASLMNQWLALASTFPKRGQSDRDAVLDAYTQLHLGFTAIHPYADGNGRMERLLANLPVLRAGYPPLTIAKESRRRYLQLMGDFSLACGAPQPGKPLVPSHPSVKRLKKFFAEEWHGSLAIVQSFFARQRERGQA